MQITTDARGFVSDAVRSNTHDIPLDLTSGSYGAETIRNRVYRFCVRRWGNVPLNERGSPRYGFTGNPNNNYIAIHCTVDNNVVTGIYHVVLDDNDIQQWQQPNSQNFRRETLHSMIRP